MHAPEQNTAGSKGSAKYQRQIIVSSANAKKAFSNQDINIQEVAEMINMDDWKTTGGNEDQEKSSQDVYSFFFF